MGSLNAQKKKKMHRKRSAVDESWKSCRIAHYMRSRRTVCISLTYQDAWPGLLDERQSSSCRSGRVSMFSATRPQVRTSRCFQASLVPHGARGLSRRSCGAR